MQFRPLRVEGAIEVTPRQFPDSRGMFAEGFRADKLAEQQRRESKWCRSYTSEPYFEITIRNAGPNAADDFTLSVSNSGDLLETTHVIILIGW